MRSFIKNCRFLPFFLLLVSSVAVPYKAHAVGSGIRWQPYAAGMKMAEERNLPVFLNFFADWCRYCVKMEKETFQESTVVDYLNENYVAIKIDVDNEGELARQYGVRGLPATVVVGLDGGRTGPMRGFLSKEALLRMLKQIDKPVKDRRQN